MLYNAGQLKKITVQTIKNDQQSSNYIGITVQIIFE